MTLQGLEESNFQITRIPHKRLVMIAFQLSREPEDKATVWIFGMAKNQIAIRYRTGPNRPDLIMAQVARKAIEVLKTYRPESELPLFVGRSA